MKRFFLTTALLLTATSQAQAAENWVPTYNPTGIQQFGQLQVGQIQRGQSSIQNGIATYVPLEPLTVWAKAAGYRGNSIGEWLTDYYPVLVALGAIVAIVFLTVGGGRYMFAETIGGIDNAKKMMWAAVWGLVIIVGSYLFLYTLNPELLKFDFNVQTVSLTQGGYYNPSVSTLPTVTRYDGSTFNPKEFVEQCTYSPPPGVTREQRQQECERAAQDIINGKADTTTQTGVWNDNQTTSVQQQTCNRGTTCDFWGGYLTYDPDGLNNIQVATGRQQFIDACENTHTDPRTGQYRRGSAKMFQLNGYFTEPMGHVGMVCVLQ